MPKTLKKLLKLFWWVPIILILVALIASVVYLGLTGTTWPAWTGFGDYTGPLIKDNRGKTLWDWMELLIIPIVLGFGALWFNRSERKNDRKIAEERNKNEQEIAADRMREAALQTYIDRMTELLLEKDLRNSKPEDEVRDVARTRTLTTLRILDPVRKGLLVRFLTEAELIRKDSPVINLSGADLNNIRLSGADLKEVNLSQAFLAKAYMDETRLSNANLSGAQLIGAHLYFDRLDKADLSRANLSEADLGRADLHGADLSGAYLIEADLREAFLGEANLAGAVLIRADLRGADLEGANLDQTEFHRTIMPDGKIHE
jgi:uncharacterized protein YjbI with pentapeptide repeats